MNTPSAATLIPADAGESLVVIRDRLVFKGRIAALIMADVEVAPFGEVPLHAHPSPEIFRVLDGEVEFAVGIADGSCKVMAMAPGDTLAIPPHTPHSYRNHSPRPIRMLALFDASLEEFFRSAGLPETAIPGEPPRPEELERVNAAATAHGMVILGPHPVMSTPD